MISSGIMLANPQLHHHQQNHQHQQIQQRTAHASYQEEDPINHNNVHSNMNSITDPINHNNVHSNMNSITEYPYSNDHNESTQIGNGQIPRESDESRRGSIKITIPRELPQRYVLVLMGFLALVNIYMMYLNLFVALPAMIDHNATESLRAFTQGNKSLEENFEKEKENILTDLEEDNRNYIKNFKNKYKRKEVDEGDSEFQLQNRKHDVEFPDDIITIPKGTTSQTLENLAPSSSVEGIVQTSSTSVALNVNEKNSPTSSREDSDSPSKKITLSTGKPESSASTTENTPLAAENEEVNRDSQNTLSSRRKREVSRKSTNQTFSTEGTQEFTTSPSFANNSEPSSTPTDINSTTPGPSLTEIGAKKEIPPFASIEITMSENSNPRLLSNKKSPTEKINTFSEFVMLPINSSSQIANNTDIANETLELNSTSKFLDFIDTQKNQTLFLNVSENSKENIESKLNVTTPSAFLSDTTESILETTIRNAQIIGLTTLSEINNNQETTLTSNVYSPTTPVLEATSLVTSNRDNDSIINSENYITESSLSVNEEVIQVPSSATYNISNDKINISQTDDTTEEPTITGVPLFTIPPIKSINNTVIPDVIKITSERTHHNTSTASVSNDSLNSKLTNVGVPLPIFNERNVSSGNITLPFRLPLSLPCQMFPSKNCTFKNTYDVLDKMGLKSSNNSSSQWVTLRPLPKSDPRDRFRNGFFSHLFGEESHRKRVSRKYNFTDHFKLVNCSRVEALTDDESDNEIKCYSSQGEIRLSIVDENEGSSSSSSSSSEEGGNSDEEGNSGEEGGNGEKVDEENDKERKGKNKRQEDDEEKKEKRKTNLSIDGRKDSRRKVLENKSNQNQNKDDETDNDNKDVEEENDKENDYKDRKISTRFPPTYLHKYLNKEDSSEENDEDEEEEEEEEDEGEEGDEEGEEGEEDEENGGKYGSSPIKLDEKIPSSVCFVKKIVGKIKFDGYEDGEFVWLPSVQREVLGAYYWGFVLTQIPAGKLSSIVGGKILVLIGIVSAGLITLLSPVLASSGAYWLLTGRVFLGMAQGLCIPALQSLLAQWAPPLERTRMVAFTYSGIALGAAFGGPFSEYALQIIGWRTLFYVQGILALLWGIFWFFLVSDSPSNHPKITNKERQKILTSIGQQHAGKGVSVPWCNIIRSQHVLALMLAQGSFKWAWHNLIHYAPRYSLTVLHRSRSEVEFVWGAALTSMFVVTCAYGAISDWLRKARKTSTEFVRRAANSICSLLTAAFLVGVAQSYCNINAVKVCFAFAIAIGLPGAFSGIYVNSIDLAPNHAAVITGICGTFATTANILAPFYWSLIVYERPTLERWRTIWYTSAIFLLLANCLYFLLVGTKEQRWNRPVTLTKGNKRREEEQGAISKRRMNYTHGFKNQAYVSTEHL